MKRQEIAAETKYWKEKLIEMAKAGEPRPRPKTPEGRKLAMYGYPSNDMFDPAFREAVSAWFGRRSMKREFLENPPETKPVWTTKEGRRFQEWMKDKKFRRAMYEKRPAWFGLEVISKEEILKLARSGAPKPHYRHKVMLAIIDYVDPQSKDFDPNFLIDLTVARPDWVLSFRRLNSSKAMSA